MANKNVTLTDDNGNNLYPVTLVNNVSGLDAELANRATTDQITNIINASSVQKNTYANLAFPSFDNRLTFDWNQIYRAPCDGYIFDRTWASPTHYCTVDIFDSTGYILYFDEYSYDGNNYNAHNHFIPIAKGYRFRVRERSDERYFVPCVGAVLSGEWTATLPKATV